mgnify:CR=1 FL=1
MQRAPPTPSAEPKEPLAAKLASNTKSGSVHALSCLYPPRRRARRVGERALRVGLVEAEQLRLRRELAEVGGGLVAVGHVELALEGDRVRRVIGSPRRARA